MNSRRSKKKIKVIGKITNEEFMERLAELENYTYSDTIIGQKPRFNKEQYALLKSCSDKKDMTEWNNWRKENPNQDVLLEKVHLDGFYLRGTWLNSGAIPLETGEWHSKMKRSDAKIYLNGASFQKADLRNVNFTEANLERVDMRGAKLQKASFFNANLKGAWLSYAQLQKCCFYEANLIGAVCRKSKLQQADFSDTLLQGATLVGAAIQSAEFKGAYMQHTNFSTSIANGETLITECEVDKDTNFSEVSLEGIRIDTQTKQLLQSNIRRKEWKSWYWDNLLKSICTGAIIIKLVVLLFWFASDYGKSTLRLLATFFITASIFAGIYYTAGNTEQDQADPGIISNLFVVQDQAESPLSFYFDGKGAIVQHEVTPIKLPKHLAMIRSLYFSIVTMTTLGFGDMFAKANCLSGHILLIFQVLLGYILLGALITRFAVLFSAGGPAGTFKKMTKIHRQLLFRILSDPRRQYM